MAKFAPPASRVGSGSEPNGRRPLAALSFRLGQSGQFLLTNFLLHMRPFRLHSLFGMCVEECVSSFKRQKAHLKPHNRTAARHCCLQPGVTRAQTASQQAGRPAGRPAIVAVTKSVPIESPPCIGQGEFNSSGLRRPLAGRARYNHNHRMASAPRATQCVVRTQRVATRTLCAQHSSSTYMRQLEIMPAGRPAGRQSLFS